MFVAMGIMLGCMLLGWLLRDRQGLSVLNRAVTPAIMLLLFSLGISVGGNERIMRDLPQLGGHALLLSLGGIAGSMLCVLYIARFFRHMPAPPYARALPAADTAPAERKTRRLRLTGLMTGSWPILACFALGLLLARLSLIPQVIVENDSTLYVLWLLMGLVGFSIGCDRRLGEILRSLRPRVLLLPLATTVGTFAGVALMSLLVPYTVSECLAVGAGFVYYSLSSIFITEYKGPELGTVGLLANIMREIITLACAPLLVRLFGPMGPISCGGASTMDTTLPVITRYAGKEWVFISIVHAMILDFSVPFWVTLFCTL